MSNGTAKCERTGKIIPLSEGAYVMNPRGEWAFVAIGTDQHGDKQMPVARLMASPEALVDWIASLNEKKATGWFDPEKFADFFTRFCRENKLRG